MHSVQRRSFLLVLLSLADTSPSPLSSAIKRPDAYLISLHPCDPLGPPQLLSLRNQTTTTTPSPPSAALSRQHAPAPPSTTFPLASPRRHHVAFFPSPLHMGGPGSPAKLFPGCRAATRRRGRGRADQVAARRLRVRRERVVCDAGNGDPGRDAKRGQGQAPGEHAVRRDRGDSEYRVVDSVAVAELISDSASSSGPRGDGVRDSSRSTAPSALW